MTTTIQIPSYPQNNSEYPVPFRFGHRYETAVGQRLVEEGFYIPVDLVVSTSGMLYVMCRSDLFPPGTIPRFRFIPVDINDEYGTPIAPMIDGKPEEPGNEFLPSPTMCAMDSNGIIFATDEHANVVSMYNTEGETLGLWGQEGTEPGRFSGPAGITFDADENLLITESRNHRVQKFSREGEYLGGWGEFGTKPGQLNHPWGISCDPINGTILVADWRNDRVQRFSSSGQVLQIIGKPGLGDGELKRPSGVAVNNHGDVYIADRGNNRVLLFNPRGMFIESFRGDANITDKGYRKLLTNPDALRLRDNVANLDVEKRLVAPTSVKVDGKGLVYIVDTGRYRVQIYRNLAKLLSPDQLDPPEMHADPVIY